MPMTDLGDALFQWLNLGTHLGLIVAIVTLIRTVTKLQMRLNILWNWFKVTHEINDAD